MSLLGDKYNIIGYISNWKTSSLCCLLKNDHWSIGVHFPSSLFHYFALVHVKVFGWLFECILIFLCLFFTQVLLCFNCFRLFHAFHLYSQRADWKFIYRFFTVSREPLLVWFRILIAYPNFMLFYDLLNNHNSKLLHPISSCWLNMFSKSISFYDCVCIHNHNLNYLYLFINVPPLLTNLGYIYYKFSLMGYAFRGNDDITQTRLMDLERRISL